VLLGGDGDLTRSEPELHASPRTSRPRDRRS